MSINQEEPIDNNEPIGVCIFRAEFKIEDGYQVASVYTDSSKAFDRVRHQLLLNEMSVGIKPHGCKACGRHGCKGFSGARI
jgi:hypothetical protein